MLDTSQPLEGVRYSPLMQQFTDRELILVGICKLVGADEFTLGRAVGAFNTAIAALALAYRSAGVCDVATGGPAAFRAIAEHVAGFTVRRHASRVACS